MKYSLLVIHVDCETVTQEIIKGEVCGSSEHNINIFPPLMPVLVRDYSGLTYVRNNPKIHLIIVNGVFIEED